MFTEQGSAAAGRVTVRRAGPADAAALHDVAAATFGLACPPGTTARAIEEFVATTLSAERFAGYLEDPARELLVAEVDGRAVGYTMLVFREPTDPDVAASVTVRPTAELSKFYVLAERHGSGTAAALMVATIESARARGVAGVWLGVNQFNPRANRFYEKSGFAVAGTKKFLVGGKYEDDFVRERVL
jgi:ribosomal protein S18 acetylase RimI-like enzyme